MSLPVDPSRYLAFLAVMAVLAVTPGPANLFAVATGLERGRRAAMLGVVGMNLASAVWFAAAALGLGAVILSFPKLFRLLAYVGAAYLVWLGARSLIAAVRGVGGPAHRLFRTSASALRDGFAVQIANPKIVVFMGAVLPPFLDPHRPLPAQFAAFACGTIGADILSMSAYGLGGAAFAHRMEEPRFARAFSALTGGLLITAAALIALRA